ncbi:MAG: repeat containing protein [Verrucomicrobiales bacterium]|nr:repeat containing protein [Verrucomicrobiales bacterium]
MKTSGFLLFTLLGLFAAGAAGAAEYAWVNLAGRQGGEGSRDGLGAEARFALSYGVATDGAGTVYVADTSNNCIRKITPAGLVSTLAGRADTFGTADGTGGEARFSFPYGVAVDGGGNVYVGDTYNHTIRKITPAGVVSTLAGLAEVGGSEDGTGAAARFGGPEGMAFDGNGTLYVADSFNHTIRKVSPAGVVTTLAGKAGTPGSADGTGSAARFNFPLGVAVDGGGNVYVSEPESHTLRKITPGGVVTTLAGKAGVSGSTDGTGAAARFSRPFNVAADGSGTLYVADIRNHTIRKVSPAGVVSTLAGLAEVAGSEDGTGAGARFNHPAGVAADGGGTVYVTDTDSHTIRKIMPSGTVTTLAGSPANLSIADGAGAAARFMYPFGAAVDGDGTVYVADGESHTIRKITPAGVVTTLAGSPDNSGSVDGTGSAARFALPVGVALDGAGTLYVADPLSSTIRKVTPGGVVTTLAGLAGSQGSADGTGAAARFNFPLGVAADRSGNVYVADSDNHTIRRVTAAGVVTTLAGLAGERGSADGAGAAARFSRPDGLAADAEGNVYVADAVNCTIRRVTAAGVVTTLAGLAGEPGSADGAGAAARFFSPVAVAVDGSGTLYVSDFGSSTVRRITPGGEVTTIGGTAGLRGSADGTGAAAHFAFPEGIAVDADGNLYVADGEGAVRRGVPVPALPPALGSWRLLHFGTTENSGAAADGFDFEGDGLVNLLEYGLGLDPKAADSPAPLRIAAGEVGGLDLHYTRSAAALSAGAVFTVEWSDNTTGPWSAEGMTETILSEDALVQRVRASVPAGPSGRRFAHLRVTAP